MQQQNQGQSHRPGVADDQPQPQPEPQRQRQRQQRSAAAMMGTMLLLALVLPLAPAATAFLLPPARFSAPATTVAAARRAAVVVGGRLSVSRMMAAGEGGGDEAPKGFGKKGSSSSSKKRALEAEAEAPAATGGGEASGPAGGPAGAAPPSLTTTEEGLAKLNARQKMAYWEVQKELEREMDLAEIEEYKETQRLLDEGVVGNLPEKISNRMLKRLIPFISMPLLGAAAMFGFYIYLAKNTDIDVPPAFVAFSTQVPFVGALIGITYSIMSTSWDPDVEGSFWGVAEFKANVLNLLESLQRSKREEQAKEKLKKYEATPAPNRAKRRELDRLTK